MMLIKNSETDGLYGFGAAAREGNSAHNRKNTHMLSFFVAALFTAVLAVMMAIVPIGSATASPLLLRVGITPDTLGVAAIGAFGVSTILCAFMLVAPVLVSRRSRHRNRL
jgi:hypothetical protein